MNNNAGETLCVECSRPVWLSERFMWKYKEEKFFFLRGRIEQVEFLNAHIFQTKEFVLYPVREVIYTKLYFLGRLMWQQGVSWIGRGRDWRQGSQVDSYYIR